MIPNKHEQRKKRRKKRRTASIKKRTNDEVQKPESCWGKYRNYIISGGVMIFVVIIIIIIVWATSNTDDKGTDDKGTDNNKPQKWRDNADEPGNDSVGPNKHDKTGSKKKIRFMFIIGCIFIGMGLSLVVAAISIYYVYADKKHWIIFLAIGLTLILAGAILVSPNFNTSK